MLYYLPPEKVIDLIILPQSSLHALGVTIKAPDGTEVTGFDVTKVVNNETGETLVDIPDNFKSNCSGYAFAGGEVWFFDPQTTDSNENAVFQSMLDDSDYFTNVSKEDANMAVIWWTDKETGERFIAHSAEVNEDGTYDQKNEYGSEEKNVDEEAFTDGHIPNPNLYDYEIEYYQKNY